MTNTTTKRKRKTQIPTTNPHAIKPPHYSSEIEPYYRRVVERLAVEHAQIGGEISASDALERARTIVDNALLDRFSIDQLDESPGGWTSNLMEYGARALRLPHDRFLLDVHAYQGDVDKLARRWQPVPRELVLARLGDLALLAADAAAELAQFFDAERVTWRARSAARSAQFVIDPCPKCGALAGKRCTGNDGGRRDRAADRALRALPLGRADAAGETTSGGLRPSGGEIGAHWRPVAASR